jgi:ureidoglycolate lyase
MLDEPGFAGAQVEMIREITPEPLTAAAFTAFGRVIEASDAVERIEINQGHAVRYDRLAELDVAEGGGVGAISLFRARPLSELVLRMFERHPLGSQSFVPLNGRPYLVAVAPAGVFDPSAVRVFRAEGHQGVHYAKGTWHHFLLVLEESDFLVVDRAGPGDNCDEVEPAEPLRVLV